MSAYDPKADISRRCAPSHLASLIQQHTRQQRQHDQNANRHVIESVHGIAPR